MKTCIKCGTEKPTSKFYKDSKCSERLRGTCIDCCAAQNKKWRSNNLGREREMGRAWRAANRLRQNRTERSRTLFRKYGLTLADYETILIAQGNKCSICREPLIAFGSHSKKACVDHNHNTGEVRGVLCWMCNCALGSMRDSIKIARACLEYLELNGAFNLETIYEKVTLCQLQ